VARSKKEERKFSPEERMIDRWNQQVFFLRKQFPNAAKQILAIEKQYTKKMEFQPTEDTLNQLTDLYIEMKGLYVPAAPLNAHVVPQAMSQDMNH
jgi:hypothetical protein